MVIGPSGQPHQRSSVNNIGDSRLTDRADNPSEIAEWPIWSLESRKQGDTRDATVDGWLLEFGSTIVEHLWLRLAS